MNTYSVLHRLAVASTLLVAVLPVAEAQQEASSSRTVSLEEITVTAQRRAESLQNVPVAVTAFSEEQLDTRQLTSTIDMVRMIPNLLGHNNTGTATANAYFMRGLGSTEQIALIDPPVATYVDEVILPRQNANNYALFDVERIEVLRGPQGTTFGRNSTGGAISVITKKPGAERTGFVSLGVGSYDRVTARGSLDLPLSDKTLTKLSIFYQDEDGFQTNLFNGEKLNGTKNWGVRGALRLLLSEAVTWDLSTEYLVSNGAFIRSLYNDARETRTVYSMAGGTGDVISDLLNKRGLRNDSNSLGVTSNIEWRMTDMTFNSITGYRSVEQQFVLDFSNPNRPPNANPPLVPITPAPGPLGLNNDGRYDMVSQEFKLTGNASESLKYVAGFFFFYEDNTTKAGQVFNASPTATLTFQCTNVVAGSGDPGQILCPNGLPGYSSWRDIRNTTTSYALYGQVDWNFAERWTAIVGARFTDEAKKVDLKPTAYGGMTTADLNRFGIPTKLTTSNVTPKFGLNYQAGENLLLYASATNGFKAGGWNSRSAFQPQVFEPMDPEKTWSYEFGAKSEFFDRRLRVNANAFYAKTKGLQLNYTTPAPGNPLIALSTQDNAGDLKVKGLELELLARFNEYVDVYGSAGYQTGEYTATTASAASFCTNGGEIVNGACANPLPPATTTVYTNAIDIYDEPSRLPKSTVALGFTVTMPLSSAGRVRFTAEGNYIGGYWTTGANSRPTLQLIPGGPYVTPGALDSYADSYAVLNMALGYESTNGQWRASLSCKNCLDGEYPTSTFNGWYFNDPRRVFGSVTYTF